MAATTAAAAGCEAPVRLRLLFDYPPPGSPACALCWLLLEPRQVRLVTDLISVIRERVRLEEVTEEDSYEKTANGFTRLSKKERKRHRQKLEAEESSSEDEEYRKRKKSKCTIEHLSNREENIQELKKLKKKEKVVTERNCTADNTTADNTSHSKKLKKRAEQEKAERAKQKPKARTLDTKTNKPFPSGLGQKCTAKNTKPQSKTKTGETSSESSTSSSDSDDNTTDIKQKLPHKTKVATLDTNKSQLESRTKSTPAGKLAAEPKNRSSCKAPNISKSASPSSSSDSDSSPGKEEEQQSSNLKKNLPHNNQGTGASCISKSKLKTSSSESDSSESDACTVKKPKTNAVQSAAGNGDKLPSDTSGPTTSPSNPGRGRGRGENAFWRGPRVRGCRGMVRGRGRGRGEGTNFFYNYNGERQKQQQLNEAATNTSVIIQNSPEAPKKDYSTLPLLAAPPQVGERIAFKLLELTENYTPEVSDYKEGKIVNWNPTNKQLELEILSFSSVAKEPGKFDLVYQSADGAETIEYAVSQERKIMETWDALIEPRLIVDPPNIESSTENGNL
ncbi:coilin isoform X2 [Tiliqua scincoides]|uniref:coilin isoform X2 n=1 Tax=Tiliqua scincoides TaxID=71010 RepID=UPI003461ED78